MSATICPYPGLRPFNEEESIFFKGREQQVERLVKRLEEKKFLMVNGASGDGKSSLIYAGVIPYAKAGFFKAKYNNWIVADFRPERSPLKNLTASICKQLKIEDHAKTEKELGYGFSALCDLYKASAFYIDESKPAWLKADDKERKVIKRKGANLLVLVDQFEEFFTNPENYQNGIPSIESQKTVNLLLETYKLAAAQDLPIYVVCTMRSDYIGQCAAFRGLPEAIGYSQFFVPRLKRQEIEQVIEGPAELAGCKISKRLAQTLLNSLTDGFDQLPILQHALHQVWKTASNGAEEMDLIHLAKVGGISSKLLNIDDKATFESWIKSLPDYKIQLFEKPSLSNVLNAHANELYLTAHISYKQRFGAAISKEQSQKIIKVVFQCLTKMDASRAVRNRMTLQEITNIINDESVNITKVDRLLQIYREQGNTFLQPFIGEAGENIELTPETVLDITHESLIRNWLQLTEWANEEFENLQNYLDFNKQLQRWINANYNNGYLLPIGPLSFFENWFEKLNPSKYWIHRYEDFAGTIEEQLQLTDERLSQARNFIQKSARKLIITKTILKYGANKLASVFGILAMIISIAYYYYDYRKKQNDYVLESVLNNGFELLNAKGVTSSYKGTFLINFDRLYPGNYLKALNKISSDTAAFEASLNTTVILLACNERSYKIQNRIYYNDAKRKIIPGLERLINYFKSKNYNKTRAIKHKQEFEKLLKAIRITSQFNHENQDTDFEAIQSVLTEILEKNLFYCLKHPKQIEMLSYTYFNEGMELDFYLKGKFSKLAKCLIEEYAPFDGNMTNFLKIYPNQDYSSGYMGQENIRNQGGFYIFGKAYAIYGNLLLTQKCLDSLFTKSPAINTFENYNTDQIILTYLKNNSNSNISELIAQYGKLTNTRILDVYLKFLRIIFFQDFTSIYSVFSETQIASKPKIRNFDLATIETFTKLLRKELITSSKKDEVLLNTCEYFKYLGFYYGSGNKIESGYYFDSLFMNLALTKKSYLASPHQLFSNSKLSNLEYICTPYIIDADYVYNLNQYNDIANTSEVLFDYLVNNWKKINATNSIKPEVFDLFFSQRNNYYNWWFSNNQNTKELKRFLFKYKSQLKKINVFNQIDTNFYNLLLGNYYLKNNQIDSSYFYFKQFSDVTLFDMKQLPNWTYKTNCIVNYKYSVGITFGLKGDHKRFEDIHKVMKNEQERANLIVKTLVYYTKNGDRIQTMNFYKKHFSSLSASALMPNKLLYINSLIGGNYLENYNIEIMQAIPDRQKESSINNIIAGYSSNNKLYKAYTFIPKLSSNSNKLKYLNTILWNIAIDNCEEIKRFYWKPFDDIINPDISNDYLNNGDYMF